MSRRKYKGYHTKPNVWDRATALKVVRGGEELEPGVNYFVLLLNQLGLDTVASCEGHPEFCYVLFDSSYDEALMISEASEGWVGIEIGSEGRWAVRWKGVQDERVRVDGLRLVADAWEKNLGPLDWNRVELSR